MQQHNNAQEAYVALMDPAHFEEEYYNQTLVGKWPTFEAFAMNHYIDAFGIDALRYANMEAYEEDLHAHYFADESANGDILVFKYF